MEYKHLTLNERKTIEELLNKGESFAKMAKRINGSKSTITREVMRNSCAKRTGAVGQAFNNCKNRRTCNQYRLCKKEDCQRQCCKSCKYCFRLCPEFERESCHKLSLPRYVCNGCKDRHKCTLEKFVYVATEAQSSYEQTLVTSRDGIATTPAELIRLDRIISPLLKRGQSIHAILENHKNEIMLDERTVYAYVRAGFFTADLFDLCNAVKMRPRKKKQDIKIERACREQRRYRDFLNFIGENSDTAIVQMDTVEGTKGSGEPVLLTIHFVEAELMLAFRREANTAKSVTEIVDSLQAKLGLETFRQLFPVILCDNGSEFSCPSAIETDSDGNLRTRVFFADPGAPYQKGACENNHTLIRRVIPKGISLAAYSQRDISLLMNHINSYTRKKLNGRSPIDVFSFLHSKQILDALGIITIPPDEVTLTPSLLKK